MWVAVFTYTLLIIQWVGGWVCVSRRCTATGGSHRVFWSSTHFPKSAPFFLYLLYFGMVSGRVVFGLASCCHHLDKIMKLNDLKRAILYYY